MQQITCNMLFRWFLGLAIDAPVWDVTVFTKNRGRPLEGDIAHRFLMGILADPVVKPLVSCEHFSVDDTLIEACASMKSFARRTAAAGRPPPGAMAIATSAARSAATRRTPPPPTAMPSCSANRRDSRRNSVIWAIC